MKKNILIIAIMAVVLSITPLFANDYYEKGNTFFTINAGVNMPTFTMFPKDPTEGSYIGMSKTHLKLGGFGSLSYQGCVSSKLAIGGEIGYNFNYAIDKKIFTQVPITARATFIAVQTGKFDVNLVANLGMEFLRYTEIRHITPFASISINPIVYVTENWGIGVNAGLQTCIEFSKNESNTAIFGTMPINLSVTYRR